MEYLVTNTGYNNTQVSRGYLELYIESVEEPILIDVTEVTSSKSHEVFMELNFNMDSEEHKQKVLSLINVDEDDNYRITDEELISELFSQYGLNSSN